jgi:hypothetical protein
MQASTDKNGLGFERQGRGPKGWRRGEGLDLSEEEDVIVGLLHRVFVPPPHRRVSLAPLALHLQRLVSHVSINQLCVCVCVLAPLALYL